MSTLRCAWLFAGTLACAVAAAQTTIKIGYATSR